MFLSAVSLGLVLGTPAQTGRLSEREQQIWQRMAPAVVTVLERGKAVGPAALIDRSGLFVAHRSSVEGDLVSARTSDGRTIQMLVKGRDALTQLVLLHAPNWKAETAVPFTSPEGDGRPGGTLLAVLSTGPIRAEFVNGRRFGVVKPSHRLVPLTELRFEAPAQAVGTALVVCENGDILGALHATLGAPQVGGSNALSNQLGGTGRLPKPIRGLPGIGASTIGPSDLTVAYTAGPEVMRKVLEGFRSPSHQIEYPSLGVLCSDNVGGGALIQQIHNGSAARLAGLKIGDVILDIAGNLIQDQVDFAKVMFRQEVGRKITLRIRRGQQVLVVDVVTGKAAE